MALGAWIEEIEGLVCAARAGREERARLRLRFAGTPGSASSRVGTGVGVAGVDRTALSQVSKARSLLDDEWQVKTRQASQGQLRARRLKREPVVRVGMAVGPETRAAALSAGYAPAVLKIVSYAHGVTRATATAQYVQRDDVQLETHDGRVLADHEAVEAEMKDWEKDFDRRRESQDVVTMRLSLSGLPPDWVAPALGLAIEAGFAGHRHVSRLEQGAKGEITARVVVVLAGTKPALRGAEGAPERERFKVDEGPHGRKLIDRYESAIKDRIGKAVGFQREQITLSVGRPGHGVEAVAYRVGQLIEAGGAMTDRGTSLRQVGEASNVARDWKGELNSFQPRDTMHLVLSAKAGVDEQAFTRAVRGFLHEQFGDHKFAFALHADKVETASHIHAHAIIAVRSEAGEKLRTGPAVLDAWREVYAAHAQSQGLKIVATRAVEQASSQSYGAKDRAIVQTADNPRAGREERDRAYARANPDLIQNARKRIETARANPVKMPTTEWQRAVATESLEVWRKRIDLDPNDNFAQTNASRLSIATRVGGDTPKLAEQRQGHTPGGTAAEMKVALNTINREAIAHAATLSGDQKAEFIARINAAMMQMAASVELKRLEEAGVTRISADDLRAIAGPAAEKIIGRADRNAQAEARETQDAGRIAQKAAQPEQGNSGNKLDSQHSLETEAARAVGAQAQWASARDRSETNNPAGAADNARLNPTQQLDDQAERLAALERAQREEMDRLRSEREAQRAKAESHGQRGPRQKM